jgi:uncharacterized protein with HEPN domain
MRSDRERLIDALEDIELIEKYTASGRAAFDSEELVQNWVLRHLQIIGEACRTTSPGLQQRYPDVPWSSIIGMRNILVHNYFELDIEIVWAVVDQDLASLKQQLQEILREMDNPR